MKFSHVRVLMIAVLVLALVNSASWGNYTQFERASGSDSDDVGGIESGWSLDAYQEDAKAAFDKVKVAVETCVRSVFTVVKAIGKAIFTVIVSIAKVAVRAVFTLVVVFAQWLLSALFSA